MTASTTSNLSMASRPRDKATAATTRTRKVDTLSNRTPILPHTPPTSRLLRASTAAILRHRLAMTSTKLCHTTMRTEGTLPILNNKATVPQLPITEIRRISSRANMAPQVPQAGPKATVDWDQRFSAALVELL